MAKNKWLYDYVEDNGLSKIEWIKSNANELDEFFQENYFDEEEMEYVIDELNDVSLPTPLGLQYLSFNFAQKDSMGYSFLLGVSNNNAGKKTIITAVMYLDSYYLFVEQKKNYNLCILFGG